MIKKISWVLIVLIQIFLLANMTAANSYMIHQAEDLINQKIIEDKNIFSKDLVGEGLGILVSLISIKQIGFVSAQDTSNYASGGGGEDITRQCCLENQDGAKCLEYSSSIIESICDSEKIVQSSCSETSSCQIGCCVDNIEGICSPRSARGECEAEGGNWNSDENCNIEDCKKGCCILSDNVAFVTDERCGHLSLLNGFEKDFGNAANELVCLAQAPNIAEGACVVRENCIFGTAQECLSRGGNFAENKLCSNSGLNTNCERQDSISCVDGKDEIYWFDSCGNRENIYSSDKDSSWNNGNVLSKAESCGSDSSNSNSDACGNCNYLWGSICKESSSPKVADGNFVCADLSCVDEKGDRRENGESWCVYDGFIGEGKDTVGSRHWKRLCVDGEVQVEPCADYRGQICVESSVDIDGEDLSNAGCVINRALECSSYNQNEKTMGVDCEENSDCFVYEVDVDDGFSFDVCTSKYPRGFELQEPDNRESNSAQQLCSGADQTCTVIYEKKLGKGPSVAIAAARGEWVCVLNCECETSKFTEQMNGLCVSLGDCGGYVNYLGEGTDSYDVDNAPSISWEDYKDYSKVVDGQKAEPEDLEDLVKIMGVGGNIQSEYGDDESSMSKIVTMVSGATGSLGSVTFLVSKMGVSVALAAKLQGFGNIAMGSAVGAIAGSIIAKVMGLSGDASLILAVTGAVGGAVIMTAVAISAKASAFCGPFAWFCFLILLVILIVIGAILKAFGIGDIKEVKVEFTCLPWQPPTGGDDCEKCDDNLLKPCTAYRCSSLGKACGIINADSSNPECIAMHNDGKFPVLTPGDISYGFNFENENRNGVDVRLDSGECVSAFTPVIFSLDSDKRAQCKYDFVRGVNYDEMAEFPLDKTYYVINHSFGFVAPSIESLQSLSVEITGDAKQKFGDFKMYIKCQDVHGNLNPKDYVVDLCVSSGPDRTAPMIVATSPINNAYLKKDVTEIPFSIYLNEPAECKYDIVRGKSYGDMANPMECDTDLIPSGISWSCSTTLTGLTNEENNFYIKCLDKPWLSGTEDELNRTVNKEDFEFKLIGTQDDLVITSTSPSGNIEQGVEPASVIVEVETAGGISNGDSICQYSFISHDSMIDNLFETGGSSHRQNFNLISGDYNIFIKCMDDAGNEDKGETTFNLNLDTTAPRVVRVFNSGGNLEIITDEKAVCYYDFERCNFNLENGTLMSTGFELNHKADWEAGKTYHIKCEDEWGNKNPECAIKIMPNIG